MINKNTVFVSLSGNKNFNHTLIKEKSKIILLKEETFIKIIRIEQGNKLEDILEKNIGNTFRSNDVLTHYESIKFNNNNYLVLYFIRYYDALRKIFKEKKDISILPYELTKYFKNGGKGLNITIRNFEDTIYLSANINKKIVYRKFFDDNKDVDKYIKECIESLERILIIENINLYIETALYKDELIQLVDKIKIIKGKVS